MWLIFAVFAMVLRGEMSYAADQKIEEGDLALFIGEKEGSIVVSYKANLVAGGLAKSQVYSVGLDGTWNMLLQGPFDHPEIAVHGNEFNSTVSSASGDTKISTSIRIARKSRIDVIVEVDTPLTPRIMGFQFGVLSAFADWMRRRRCSERRSQEGAVWQMLPAEGKSDDSRFLLKGKMGLTIEGALLSISVDSGGLCRVLA